LYPIPLYLYTLTYTPIHLYTYTPLPYLPTPPLPPQIPEAFAETPAGRRVCRTSLSCRPPSSTSALRDALLLCQRHHPKPIQTRPGSCHLLLSCRIPFCPQGIRFV